MWKDTVSTNSSTLAEPKHLFFFKCRGASGYQWDITLLFSLAKPVYGTTTGEIEDHFFDRGVG